MSQYRSRDAWDPTVMTDGEAVKSESPEPKEELDFHAEAPPPAASRTTKRTSRLAWLVTLGVVAAAVGLALLYYVPLSDSVKRLAQELAAARAENSKLVDKLATLDRTKSTLEEEQAQLQAAVKEKEDALNELTKMQEELAEKLQAEIKKGDVLINQRGGQLVVDLVDQIMFDSGSSQLNPQGKAVLKKVGETLLKLSDKAIQVGGHTDNVPISTRLDDKFPSNWELSTARATNVVRFLQDEIKVPGERLVAAGFSEYRPSNSNKTASGRRKNRRIEVVLLPATGAHPSVPKHKK